MEELLVKGYQPNLCKRKTLFFVRFFCCWIIYWLCSLCIPSYAQPATAGDPYNFVYRSWNNESGLPQNTVYRVVQDSTGYLWGATEEGLFRFDGAEFSLINLANTPSLISHTFYDFAVSGRNVWAAGNNSVVRLSHKVERVWDLRDQVSGGWIKSIELDKKGKLWIGTSNGRLLVLNGDSIYNYPQWERGMGSSIEVIKQSAHGLLIGTSQGLYRISGNDPVPRPHPLFSGVGILAIEPAADGSIWLGAASRGLCHLSTDTTWYSDKNGLRENFINSLHYASDGRLWVGTRSAGYQVVENGKLITPDQAGHEHDGIRSILTTSKGIVWMGTTSSGLLQLRPALLGGPLPQQELAGKIILAIYQHPNGDQWISTAGKGIHRWSKGLLTKFDQTNGLANNVVLSIYGRGDYVYIGSTNGLTRFNNTTGRIDRQYTTKDGLLNNGVICLFNDSRNRLWITTRLGGLHVMDENEVIKAVEPPSGDRPNIIAAYEDKQQNIWFGTRGNGVFKMDREGHIARYHHKEGFAGEIVYDFYTDREGDMWMSTDVGLIVQYEGKFHLLEKTAGLFFRESYRMLEDSKGFLWLTGNQGLQRVSAEEMIRAKKAGGKDRMAVRLFNAFDGMPNAETNGGFYPAGWAMADGTLWFPTVQGVSVADPGNIGKESNDLNVLIQSLRFGDHTFYPGIDDIEIPPGVYNFEIRYTSIDFSKASDIQYYFRLKGTDEWTPTGNKRVVYFSSLEPGSYTFEVKAERYGHWSPTAQLSFRIKPYFYDTLWFKIISRTLFLLIIAAIFWAVRRALRRKLREQQLITRAQINGQEKERQFISSELHDSVNQQLTTAKIYLDYAKSQEENRQELIEKSEEMVQSVISEIRTLCNSLTPPGLKDIGLEEALEDLVGSYTSVGKFEAQLRFDVDSEQLDEELQFTIYRITQEQLNNIARHAQAKNVWLFFHVSAQTLHMSIRDDGRGFDARTQPFGMGFTNIRNRLLLFQGKMELLTTPGRGCTLEVHVPLKKR